MKQEVRTMLENMYDLLIEKFHDPIKSWDCLIEFLAADNWGQLLYQLNHNFEWLFKDSDLADSIMRTYDSELLRSDYYDHLGDIYLDKLVSTKEAVKKGIYLTPKNVADLLSQMTIPKPQGLLKILDPGAGTGRLLMAAYKKAPNSILFGVEPDLRLLRIALTNFVIHDIPGYLLNANSLLHEIDISTQDGRDNWQFANKWYSCTDKLKSLHKDLNYSLQPEPPQKRQNK